MNPVSSKKRPAKTPAWSVQKKIKENRVERHEKKAKRRAAIAIKVDAAIAQNSIGKPADWKEKLINKKSGS